MNGLKVSELIRQLQELQEKHGDLPVKYGSWSEGIIMNIEGTEYELDTECTPPFEAIIIKETNNE